MAAENYHLKWDSHLSYLNSSVVTLYKNEKFADVVLYSSKSVSSGGVGASGPSSVDNGLPMVGISAHKFILSSCSQFFAAMFEAAPISAPNGGVLYVVLPPDLSHRAIQILVQYMYSGEATVANDILNEVLRGGEILKIRGLCRTTGSHPLRDPATATGANGSSSAGTSTSSTAPYGLNGSRTANNHNHTHAHSSTHGLGPHAAAAVAATSSTCAPSAAVPSGPRYGLEQLQQQQQHQHHHHQQFRGLGASVMPKDSPVIVKSPKLSGLGGPGSGTTNSIAANTSGSNSQKLSTGGISVNKDVAIDPEDKCGYGSRTSRQQQHESAALSALSGASLCCEVGCSSCPMVGDAATTQQLQRRQRSHSDELASTLRLSVERLNREYTERPPPDEAYAHDDELDMRYSHPQHHHQPPQQRLQRTSTNEPVHDYFMADHYDSPSASSKQSFGKAVDARVSVSPPHPHTFLTIKQEPADWSSGPVAAAGANVDDCGERGEHEQDTDHRSRPVTPKQPLDFKMPLSSVAAAATAAAAAAAANTIATAVSVKLETGSAHSADEDELPAPPTNDYDSFQCLECEFCKQTFDDPKTWVRHVTTHAAHAVPVGVMGGSNQCLNLAEETGAGGGSGSGSGSGSAMASNGGGDFLSKSYVPKKRRRVSQQENSLDHVTLLCDLCATSFETPAEWVRHMNNQHTEIELAMFNSKKDSELKSNANSTDTAGSGMSNSGGGSASYPTQLHKKYSNTHRTSLGYTASIEQPPAHDRQCDICSKKFSSHSNMLLHKRNHGVQLNGGGHSHVHAHHDHSHGHSHGHGHGHSKGAASASLSSGQVLESEQRTRHSRTPSQM